MRTVNRYIAAVCVLAMASSAMALTTEGTVWPAHSWGQTFTEDAGAGVFNRIELALAKEPPAALELLSNFSVAGWSQDKMLGTNALSASGGAVSKLTFDVTFEGVPTSPVVFTFSARNDSAVVCEALVSWSGSAWTIQPIQGEILSGPVPEPLTMVSAFLAIGGLGMYVRKRTRRPQQAG
ncbi:MAG: hypothetical protein ACE15C_18210 [Phycisphaerae bacterium]